MECKAGPLLFPLPIPKKLLKLKLLGAEAAATPLWKGQYSDLIVVGRYKRSRAAGLGIKRKHACSSPLLKAGFVREVRRVRKLLVQTVMPNRRLARSGIRACRLSRHLLYQCCLSSEEVIYIWTDG